MPQTERKAKGRHSPRERRRIAAVVFAACVLLAAAAAVWFFRGSFTADRLLSLAEPTPAAGAFVYDSGADQSFAAAGQGLAVVTSAGFELLDGSGAKAAAQVAALDDPAVCACADYAAFYDLGGTSCLLADFSGQITPLTAQGGILSVTVSGDGYLAVTARRTGYRGVVTVYNPEHKAVYEWYSSSAWVISAAVSPDSRRLAVLSYDASGSRVDFLSLTGETVQGSFSSAGTLLMDFHWLSAKALAAYSSDEALFFTSDGSWAGTYSFDGQYLTGCALDGSGFAAFAVSQYRSGTTGTLVTLDAEGKVLGTAELGSGLLSLDASGGELLALCSDGAYLYSSSLTRKGSLSDVTGFKCALLRARGSALLLASSYAEVYKF